MYETLRNAFAGTKAVLVLEVDGVIEVWHYTTKIFSYDEKSEELILANGGFFTATTKKHINKCLSLTFSFLFIEQKGGKWFISTPSGAEEFVGTFIF